MTIDEAIAKYKEITNSDTPCPRYCMLPCDKCVQESGQIAEWLEELKDYRDKNKMVVRIDVENMDSIKDKIEELSKYAESQYNKAIDDFVERLTTYLGIENATKYGNKNAEQMRNSYGTFMNYEIAESIEDVAEQLKAGVTND